ncbi:MAG: hypothetical protein WA996_23035 [Candidatus Promineifilaceae bacterium]
MRRAGAIPVAKQVKLADLADNMDVSRLSSRTERDRARLKKYEAAVAVLKNEGNSFTEV